MLTNEFDENTTFYSYIPVESKVRSLAETYPNSYQTVFFICCREKLNRERHSGGMSKKDADTLKQQQNSNAKVERSMKKRLETTTLKKNQMFNAV